MMMEINGVHSKCSCGYWWIHTYVLEDKKWASIQILLNCKCGGFVEQLDHKAAFHFLPLDGSKSKFSACDRKCPI